MTHIELLWEPRLPGRSYRALIWVNGLPQIVTTVSHALKYAKR